MKVHGRLKLDEFLKTHGDVRTQVEAWLAEVKDAEWQSPSDIKRRYVHASFLGDRRVVFNLKGNKYRLDVNISYKNQTVVIIRIGTHAEYSRWTF
jgi:mRNA interferase HigB